MEFFIAWFVLAVVVAVIADARGRSAFGYFMLSVFLSPLIGLILAVALPSRTPAAGQDDRRRLACPQCAEMVLYVALKCPHCGFAIGEHIAKGTAEANARAYAARQERQRKNEARGQRLRAMLGGKKPPAGPP